MSEWMRRCVDNVEDLLKLLPQILQSKLLSCGEKKVTFLLQPSKLPCSLLTQNQSFPFFQTPSPNGLPHYPLSSHLFPTSTFPTLILCPFDFFSTRTLFTHNPPPHPMANPMYPHPAFLTPVYSNFPTLLNRRLRPQSLEMPPPFSQCGC